MTRKKYWLLPIFIILGIFGMLIILSQGSAVAPFVYIILVDDIYIGHFLLIS